MTCDVVCVDEITQHPALFGLQHQQMAAAEDDCDAASAKPANGRDRHDRVVRYRAADVRWCGHDTSDTPGDDATVGHTQDKDRAREVQARGACGGAHVEPPPSAQQPTTIVDGAAAAHTHETGSEQRLTGLQVALEEREMTASPTVQAAEITLPRW